MEEVVDMYYCITAFERSLNSSASIQYAWICTNINPNISITGISRQKTTKHYATDTGNSNGNLLVVSPLEFCEGVQVHNIESTFSIINLTVWSVMVRMARRLFLLAWVSNWAEIQDNTYALSSSHNHWLG